MKLVRLGKKTTTFDFVNTLLVIFITFVIAYPLYFCIIASFSEPQEVAAGNTLLWIKGFTAEAYQYILAEKQVWIGFRNSVIYTVLGTCYNLILTIPAAYVLSKKDLPFRSALSWFFLFTMYFSGGMIPTYLLYKSLHLLDKPIALIIGAGVSCYNLIITRQYFEDSIPSDLYEAAYIDGSSEFKTFMKVALPLSKPIVAVVALSHAVTHWNAWYNALLYIQNRAYYPLQLVLRNIVFKSQQIAIDSDATAETIAYLLRKAEMGEAMKYGLIIITSLPMLIAYPFVQKHFTKGIMVGSVKG